VNVHRAGSSGLTGVEQQIEERGAQHIGIG
jgi:hypothetical protein